MVAALRQAIEQFRSVEPKEAQAAWSAGKPLAEALGDLDEALDRGRREIEQAQPPASPRSPTLALADALDERFRRQSWLRRRLTAGYHRQVLERRPRTPAGCAATCFDSLLEGYGLIQNRLAPGDGGRADRAHPLRGPARSIPSG